MCVSDFHANSIWTVRVSIKDLVSFKHQYSLNCLSALGVDILRIVLIEVSVSFECRYSPNHLSQGLGQLRVSIFSNRERRAPDQLWVSIFSDPMVASLLNEWEGPQSALSIGILRPFDGIATKCIWQKGEGPLSTARIDILRHFDGLANMHSTERGGPRSASSIDIFQPIGSFATKWKGRAPSQL